VESSEFVELNLSQHQGFGQTELDRVGRRWLRHAWLANMPFDENGAFVPAAESLFLQGWNWDGPGKKAADSSSPAAFAIVITS
jgi:hypothetical protein